MHTFLCPDLSASNVKCYTEWGFTYAIHSPGPSRDKSGNVTHLLRGINLDTSTVYDSSNGTMSFGFIVRTNKGQFTGTKID